MDETRKVLRGAAAELFEIFAQHERDPQAKAELAARADTLRAMSHEGGDTRTVAPLREPRQ